MWTSYRNCWQFKWSNTYCKAVFIDISASCEWTETVQTAECQTLSILTQLIYQTYRRKHTYLILQRPRRDLSINFSDEYSWKCTFYNKIFPHCSSFWIMYESRETAVMAAKLLVLLKLLHGCLHGWPNIVTNRVAVVFMHVSGCLFFCRFRSLGKLWWLPLSGLWFWNFTRLSWARGYR